MKKMYYIRKGSSIISDTGYIGNIIRENREYVTVDYFYNPRSGVGYKNYRIRKDLIFLKE